MIILLLLGLFLLLHYRKKVICIENKDFEVLVTETDDEIVVTGSNIRQDLIYAQAFDRYDPSNRTYQSVMKDHVSNSDAVTLDDIQELSVNAQSDLNKILRINSILEPIVNRNGLIGVTYDAIKRNTNDEYKITYKEFNGNNVKKKRTSEKAKSIIEDFNNQIAIKRVIKTTTPYTYLKGNRIMYLRGNHKDGWIIDTYPLGIGVISSFRHAGHPICLVDIKALQNALKKTTLFDKKKKPLFYKNLEEEIKNNYPKEVYEAYKNGERYAKLDPERTGVVQLNTLGKDYGLSPLFKSLEDYVMLETFKKADGINSKASAKKIIFQKTRSDLLNLQKLNSFGEVAYAHNTLMDALAQQLVVVTTAPYVESIEYVEPKVKLTDNATMNQYQKSFANALGISFLANDNGSTVATSTISIKQLLYTINDITSSLEEVIDKFYRFVLKDNKVSFDFLPKITIVDSELLEFEMKKQLAEFLFNRLNSSYETAYSVLGYDINDEKNKRLKENEDKIDEVFFPRKTSATVSKYDMQGDDFTDNKGGRPEGNNLDKKDKQDYDKVRQDNKQ